MSLNESEKTRGVHATLVVWYNNILPCPYYDVYVCVSLFLCTFLIVNASNEVTVSLVTRQCATLLFPFRMEIKHSPVCVVYVRVNNTPTPEPCKLFTSQYIPTPHLVHAMIQWGFFHIKWWPTLCIHQCNWHWLRIIGIKVKGKLFLLQSQLPTCLIFLWIIELWICWNFVFHVRSLYY